MHVGDYYYFFPQKETSCLGQLQQFNHIFQAHRTNKWKSLFGHKDKPRNGSSFVGHVTWQKLWTDSFLVQEFSHKTYFPYQLAEPDKFLKQAKVLYELLFNFPYDIRLGVLACTELLLVGLLFFWINHCLLWLDRENGVWLNTFHQFLVPSTEPLSLTGFLWVFIERILIHFDLDWWLARDKHDSRAAELSKSKHCIVWPSSGFNVGDGDKGEIEGVQALWNCVGDVIC